MQADKHKREHPLSFAKNNPLGCFTTASNGTGFAWAGAVVLLGKTQEGERITEIHLFHALMRVYLRRKCVNLGGLHYTYVMYM